ncbi:MAG TPA: hypothetical protein VF519_15370 [Mycobacteriales bacterium]
MKRIILGVAAGVLALSGPVAHAACAGAGCVPAGAFAVRDLTDCDEGGSEDCRVCVLTDQTRIVCTP